MSENKTGCKILWVDSPGGDVGSRVDLRHQLVVINEVARDSVAVHLEKCNLAFEEFAVIVGEAATSFEHLREISIKLNNNQVPGKSYDKFIPKTIGNRRRK